MNKLRSLTIIGRDFLKVVGVISLVVVGYFVVSWILIIRHEIERDSQPVTTEHLFNKSFVQPSFREVLDFQEAKLDADNKQVLTTIWTFRLPLGRTVSYFEPLYPIAASKNASQIFLHSFPNKSGLLADEKSLNWLGPSKERNLSWAVLARHRPTNTFFYLYVLDFRESS